MVRTNERSPRIHTEIQEAYSGGVDATTDQIILPTDICQLMQNAYPARSGRAVSRPGVTNLFANARSNQFRMLTRYTSLDGSTFDAMVAVEGANMLKITDAGTITSLSSSIAATGTMAYETWNDKLYYSDGTHKLRSINSSGTDAEESASYNFSYLAARDASARLFGIQADAPENLRWCIGTDPSDWAGDGSGVYVSRSGYFTACIEMGDSFILFEEDRMWRIDGTDPDTWTVSGISSNGIGCVAPETLKVVEGVAIFLSKQGVAYYDGSRPRILSTNVEGYLPLDDSVWDDSFAVVTRDWYMLFYPNSSISNGCDRALVYDYRLNAWGGPWTFATGLVQGVCSFGQSGTSGRIYLTDYAKRIVHENTTHDDNGAAFGVKIRGRGMTGERAAIDKILKELRVLYETSAAGTVSAYIVAEDESSARSGMTKAATISGAMTDVISLRLSNSRCTEWAVEIATVSKIGLEVRKVEVDYFFVQKHS